MFTIDTRKIPENGSLLLEGSLDEDIFELPEGDLAKPASPLNYKAEASLVIDSLLLRGDFSISFKLQCVRCAQAFNYGVLLAEHAILAPLETGSLMDLTNALREDIILALPSFPRCDEGSPGDPQGSRECPATGSFEAEESFAPLDPEQDESKGSDSWGALDNLKLD
jgi:uncharacterized protein